jgi:PH (Pleckstrin Homology) domain-containing protein
MPAVSEPELPHTWRPLGVRLASAFFGGLLLVVCVSGWIAVGPDVRGRVTPYQQVTLLLLGVAFAAVLWALIRCRVTASEQGLLLVNGFRRHSYEWPELLAVHMPRGAPFATLDLADGTSIQALGIQSSDGDRARIAVAQLRMLLERTARESLHRPDPPAD